MPVINSDNQYNGGITYSTPAFIFGNTGSVNGGYSFDLPLATVAAFNSQGLDFLAANSKEARGFFTTIERSANQGLRRTENAAFGLASSGLRTLQNISAMSIASQERINAITQIESTKRVEAMPEPDSGWCFITTAVCEAESLPDDCAELTILRSFRDGFMDSDDDMREMVLQYYNIAPGIVYLLKSKPDGGKADFAALKRIYIEPAIQAIKSGNNQLALEIYRAMVGAAGKMAKDA